MAASLSDPVTSGGLLFSFPRERLQDLEKKAQELGIKLWIIGGVDMLRFFRKPLLVLGVAGWFFAFNSAPAVAGLVGSKLKASFRKHIKKRGGSC